jgi:hypothetical protein
MEGSLGWKVGIVVDDGFGSRTMIKNSFDALGYLDGRWPIDRGIFRSAARRHCNASLNGKIPPDASRKPFIAALIEADLDFI